MAIKEFATCCVLLWKIFIDSGYFHENALIDGSKKTGKSKMNDWIETAFLDLILFTVLMIWAGGN